MYCITICCSAILGASTLTNFTNSGTITGSSGVFTLNTARITTLTNTTTGIINSNNAAGRFAAIEVQGTSRIDTLINAGRIDNTANANIQALRVQAGSSVGTIENQGTGTIMGISTARGRCPKERGDGKGE